MIVLAKILGAPRAYFRFAVEEVSRDRSHGHDPLMLGVGFLLFFVLVPLLIVAVVALVVIGFLLAFITCGWIGRVALIASPLPFVAYFWFFLGLTDPERDRHNTHHR